MRLRNLQTKDAPLILECINDESILERLEETTIKSNLSEVQSFIRSSRNRNKGNNLFLAIVSDEDEFMGIVGVKNIEHESNSGEFFISVRKNAMGRGYAWYGMEEIIKLVFEKYGLESVYWCVNRKNNRAVRFYEKHNFHEAVDITPVILEKYKNASELRWYSVHKGDVFDEQTNVAGCKIIRIKTVPTVNLGELSFFESNRDIPFDIKRIYYISKVPEGTRRGFHAHKKLKQLLFCPYGRIQLILENRNGREEIELSDPSIGVVIEEPTWREMLWIQKDSVLCVAASDFYDVEDYIRDYNEFRGFIGTNE